MKLYYKPGACPLASHIALQETGRPFEIEAVDTAAGRTEGGADYLAINPKGYVPALRLEDGSILTEGPAILQYIADSHSEAGLAPAAGTFARARMQEQLNWIGTELHKAFGPLFREGTSEAGQDEARVAVAGKFDLIETQLEDGREWLVADQFSVADAYLFVVSNWANFTGIDLARWPYLAAFVSRTAARQSAQAAMRAEGLIQ
ncbi:glutathione S-transferase [Phaeobacter inhibens]|uniref:Glutathione S-transferase n=1 Tax=Phaeobacter inhibens TaxID=221822 RepID=A0A2I7LUR1_9RHOB|nr:glutathione transferase GstA [Phaeobacter inhibens]AFO88635.1 glutathione S-transferase [Phaeobacter inhibens 2.10]AUQ48784.1 glutathione S-transferase [Phaeobacter inhibens]AUQ93284.1 glutathione S-transferase [Phaeobacter inhibens]AUR00238.1 glutathione S-transferase [Phaeobacter inhibens]AUR04850.1 glutathione S-transferase [Phaeobacter inhibens]